MKPKFMILAAAVLLAVAAVFYASAPLQHAQSFVYLYGQRIEDSLQAGDGVPEGLGCESISFWQGEHEMVEFLFSGWGLGSQTSYYGCYYSPDDVPLPFQNSGEALIQESEDSWSWTGEGDNRGKTRKLDDCWYYFEASF